jgi:predicted transcriptional regulator YdeE
VYNLYCDYESDHRGRYKVIIGSPVKSIDFTPEGLTGKRIPRTKYAVYKRSGKLPYVVLETWNAVYHEKKYTRKFLADFDFYDMNAYDPQNVRVEVNVSIK